MRLLVFSDAHTDLTACRDLVGRSARVDLVVGAGDFATRHEGLVATLRALGASSTAAAVVPGNNERPEALRAACAEVWRSAVVLHGEVAEVGGVRVAGLGAGVPPTGKDWSYDLTEEEAGAMGEALVEAARSAWGDGGVDVLVTHAPPKGLCDEAAPGVSMGSEALAGLVRCLSPRVMVCGHVHASWRRHGWVGRTLVYNAGPLGAVVDVQEEGSIVVQRPHEGPVMGTGETSWLDDVLVLRPPV